MRDRKQLRGELGKESVSLAERFEEPRIAQPGLRPEPMVNHESHGFNE